ncbi:MAG: putative porin, partial [Candidatus Sericytochromatia bacterium]|nr:putative porin [Candidatus Sericytochromatia bacterium]
MKIKLFSSLLCSLLSVSYPSISYAQEINLTDVSVNHWAYSALEKVIKKYNFKIGYPDNTFRGNKNITRYEVASLLAQVLEKSDSKSMSGDDLRVIKEMVEKYSLDLEIYKETIKEKIELIEDRMDILDAMTDKQAAIFGDFMDSFPFIIKGDVAFRYQLITQQPGQDFKNQVPQARFSLSLESRENQPIGYGVKILSGGINKITNKWWKLADFNAGIPINVDRLFISYKPANFFEFTIGKFKDPFANTEIYMDEEISPQGALQTFKFNDLSEVFKEVSFTAGEYIVNMDKDFGNTFSLNGSAELKMNFTDFVGVNLKGGYYNYIDANNIAKANIAPEPVVSPTTATFTPRITGNINSNTLDSTGNYKANFNIFNGFAKVIFRINDR